MYLDPGGNLETDVVVVGTGPGGLAAVGSAAASGVQVVSIEAHDSIGGNGVFSTGWVSFVDTKLQREHGIEDSVELFMGDCEKLVEESEATYGLLWDRQLTELYARKSTKIYESLTEQGIKLDRLIKRPLQTSVDRLTAVENTSMFPQGFESDFGGPNVKTFLRCTMKRLLFEDGAVNGVRVEPNNGSKAFNVRARKAVILATGGYQANPELRRRCQPDKPVMGIYPGLETSRGDGHLLEEAIAVNAMGQRFHDEAGPYQARVDALSLIQDKIGHYIYDNCIFRRKRPYVEQTAGPRVQAHSLAELAQKIGVPIDTFEQTIRDWNDFQMSGKAKDEPTGRVQFAHDRQPITEPPFYSNPMMVGVSLSCGGFVTTLSMQVVDIFGEAVPGLFAVGDCAGGVLPTAEMGGTHLGGGFVLGWVAGEAAATGCLAPVHTRPSFGAFVSKSTIPAQLNGPIINVGPTELKKEVVLDVGDEKVLLERALRISS